MEYLCIETFSLPLYDDEGFLIENKWRKVNKGSTWRIDETSNILGGEVHLETKRGSKYFGWIEISKDILNNNFRREVLNPLSRLAESLPEEQAKRVLDPFGLRRNKE